MERAGRPKIMKKRKFSVYIVFIFALLIIATVGGIVSIVYFEYKKSARETAREQFQKEIKVLAERTAEYLRIAQLTTEIATEVFNKPNLELKLNSEESHYLLEALLTHQQIELLYYGDETGSYLQAADFADVYTKVIHQKNGGAHTVYNYYDKNKKLLNTKTYTDTKYDPRKRPWYIGAKKTKNIFWTDPYIFFENGKPGITVAVPVFKNNRELQGVVAADITLDGLTKFLQNVELSENGLAFITDGKNQLLAFSGKQKIIVTVNGKIRSLKVNELAVPAVKAMLKVHPDHKEDFITFSSDKIKYYAATIPFPKSTGKNWYSTIISPESDFTGTMEQTLGKILYLSLGALAIGVLTTTFLAQRISKPIEMLSEDVLEVRNFNLDTDSGVKSHIHEIQTMDNAIKAMKNSLKAFKLYLPSVLVKQLIESGENIEIGGKEKELTLFFSDIKDYTPITENTPPQELMIQLSEYFDMMTTIIEGEKGTVDKFIADSVMAFWNAPLDNEDHHYDACKAALDCQKKLKELNEKWEKEGQNIFHTRIGIHTSLATVGNMGAKQRMNYTALGDGVNLASRLEGVNKIYKTTIIISDETYKHVKELFECRILDKIAVKGKSKAIKIYELLTEHNSPEAEKFAKFAKGFENIYEIFLKREWQKAKDLFAERFKEYPDDFVCKLYIKRCEQFLMEEPPSDWNGVTKLETK